MSDYKSSCCDKPLRKYLASTNIFADDEKAVWRCSKCKKEYEQIGFNLYEKET